MGWLTIFVFGTLHGLQPDHLAAAGALAARTGASVMAAAMRVAAGHAGALLAFALAAMLLPAGLPERLEVWADAIAGASLAIIGVAVILQALRGRYVVHSHEHTHGDKTHEHTHVHPARTDHEHVQAHEHRHLKGAIAVGLVLGIGGARSLVVLLPRVAGPGSGLLAIAVYCGGIFIGIAVLARIVDWVRRLATTDKRARALDATLGLGAFVAGAHMLVTGL